MNRILAAACMIVALLGIAIAARTYQRHAAREQCIVYLDTNSSRLNFVDDEMSLIDELSWSFDDERDIASVTQRLSACHKVIQWQRLHISILPPISDTALLTLADVPTITQLSIRAPDGNAIAVLNRFPELEELYIRSPVDGADFEGLPQITSLVALGVPDAVAADRLVMHLVDAAPDLDWIDLSGSDLTDEGVAHLVELRKLQTLSLNETRITIDGLQSLAALKELEFVSALGTAVDSAGFESSSFDFTIRVE